MKVPSKTQIAAAVAEFVKAGRFLTDGEFRMAKFLEDPIAAALRAAEKHRPAIIQDQEAIDQAHGKMRFRVETWLRDGSEIEAAVAVCTHLAVAEAAYGAAIPAYPSSMVVLRDHRRAIGRSEPMVPIHSTSRNEAKPSLDRGED